MKALAVLAAALVLAGLTATTGRTAATKSPKALYTALLTTAFADSELPDGFFSAKVSLDRPGKAATKHHVVGEVSVSVDGPDPDDFIEYAVFPSQADAMADLHDNTGGSLDHYKVMGKVPGYSFRSQWITGSITGKNAFGKTITNGITALYLVKGNVLMAAITDSGDNEDSGNMPAALQLLKTALRHVNRLAR